MKVFPRVIINACLNRVRNDGFFFDTEFLLLAERSGYSIEQIPSDCYDMKKNILKVFSYILEESIGLLTLRLRLLFRG